VAQLVLVGVAVIVSQLDLASRTNMAIVLALTLLNAAVIAVLLLGVRRDGRLVWMLAAITAVLVLGLLAWPAWDIYERVRP
jgi:FtsH-binding integral membrane protein